MNNKLETCKDEKAGVHLTAVGVRFKPSGKIYTFEIGDIDVKSGTWVVVESEMGVSMGLIAKPKHSIENVEKPLKKVLRIASDKDMEKNKKNLSFAEEARTFCIEKIKSRNLPMKIVSTETTLDRKRLIFYFTADGRIDFRELVKDLASRFKTRIEMRQIGVRDEVKLIGGIGVCGRETCCSRFLISFEPVSIRMAKRQELSINQSKLSGICGRLMCCLGYEYDEFIEAKRERKPCAGAKTASAASTAKVHGSETAPKDKTEMPSDSSEDKKISPAGKEAAVSSPSGEVSAEVKPKASRHRKRKRDAGSKSHATKSEDKKKGKAFSKRRKFWKKKKTRNKEAKDKQTGS